MHTPSTELNVRTESAPLPELQPYQPERQHDWVRLIVTIGLLAAFGATVIWTMRQSNAAPAQWTQTKEMLQILLPAVTGLLGSVIGFYFGSSAARRQP